MSSMSGRTVLVTGATDGIGRATAVGLAEMGAHVLVHGRDAARVAAVVREVRAAGAAGAGGLVADLALRSEVRRLAAEIAARRSRLHVLINNAGVFMRERRLTPDGLETTFAVNYLAPFLLTTLLLDELRASAPSRVVNVSSGAHLHASLDLADLQGERAFSGNHAYGASKLALTMFTVELAQRLTGSGVTVNAVHPGVVKTKLLMSGWRYGSFAGLSVIRGARAPLYVAGSQEVEGVSGVYFSGARPAPTAAAVRDAVTRRRLWAASERLAGSHEGAVPRTSRGVAAR